MTTYSLLRLGLTLSEADEVEHGRAMDLLAIHSVVRKHEAKQEASRG